MQPHDTFFGAPARNHFSSLWDFFFHMSSTGQNPPVVNKQGIPQISYTIPECSCKLTGIKPVKKFSLNIF